MNNKQIILATQVAFSAAVILLTGSPVASAVPDLMPADGESGAVTGAGAGPTLGVGGTSSYTGGSTSTGFCGDPSTYTGTSTAAICSGASVGVGGPSSYTGGSTANNPHNTASLGVGGVDSYTGQGTAGATLNGTNTTTRTVNYGPG